MKDVKKLALLSFLLGYVLFAYNVVLHSALSAQANKFSPLDGLNEKKLVSILKDQFPHASI